MAIGDASEKSTPIGNSSGDAGRVAGLASAAGNGAGGVAGKAVEGDGSSNVRRYTGKAVAGAVNGGMTGGLHGAAIGAAKEVGVEAAKDAIKGASKVTGGGPDAEPADKRLGAGGTSYDRPRSEQEGFGSKAAKVAVVGGAAAATPAAMAVVVLMALLNWLKSMFFALMAMAANLASFLWSFLLTVTKTVGKAVAAPFVFVGNVFGQMAAAVFGVTAVTVAPVAAVFSGVVAIMTVMAMLGAVLIGVIDNTAATEGRVDETECINPFGSDSSVPSGEAPKDTMDAAREVYRVLSGWGMPDENIAGILGNWDVESGVDPFGVESIFTEPFRIGPRKQAAWDGNFTHIPGQSHGGIGLGQWSNARTMNLLDFARKSGGNWHDIDIQLRFMISADEGSDAGIVRDMIESSKGSPEAASRFFHLKWERSRSRNSSERNARAVTWMGRISDMAKGESSSSPRDSNAAEETSSSSLILAQPARWDREPVRKPKSMTGGRVYHTKNGNYALENSIQGLDKAKSLGYAGIDIDSWVTRDGVLVAIHWPRPSKNGFKGKGSGKRVPDLTYAQLRAMRHPKGYRIETMETMFREAAKRDLRIEWEIKYARAYEFTRTFVPLRRVASEVGLNVQVKTQGGSTAAAQLARLQAAHQAGFPTIVMTQKRRSIPRAWWPWIDYYSDGGGSPRWYGPLSTHRGSTAPRPGSTSFTQVGSTGGGCSCQMSARQRDTTMALSGSGQPGGKLNLGPVKPHVQEAAEIINDKFPGIGTVGGYRAGGSRDPNGHPAGLAVDFMVPMTAAGKATGDAVAEFAIQNAQALNVKYIIWRQRIWNVSRGDTSWRAMEDRGSPTQNHMDHPHISFLPSGSVTDIVDPPPTNDPACAGMGNTGAGAGTPALRDGGMDQSEAKALVDLYNMEGDKFLDDRYGNQGGPGSCGNNHAMNCVSFSTYFVNKYTSFDKYPQGDGIQTAGRIASMLGRKLSTQPTPYSVGSGPASTPAGHTFVVLGVQGDKVIVGEAGYCAYMGRVSVRSASELAAAGWKFVDVSDLLTNSKLA